MFGEILSVELVGISPPTFKCRTKDGESPKVCSIAVSDLEAESEAASILWSLVAAPEDARPELEALRDSLSESDLESKFVYQPIEARIIGEPVPLEEWRPDDPRVIATMNEITAEIEQIAVPIAEIRYGEVPSGFFQTRPLRGKPKPLQPGHWYEIAIQGFDSGKLEFTVQT